MRIEHQRSANRFVARVQAGEAVLLYAPAGDKVLEFYSTFVPPDARGRGLASSLVEAALGFAREEGFQVIPSCWYVASWMQSRPEYHDLLAA